MNTMFSVEESNLICIFEGESRNEVIGSIESVLPHLGDTDMEELSNRVLEKLRNITDEEFAELDLIMLEE